MYDYQDHYSRLTVEREKAVYQKLLSQYNQLLWAADEGVYEVTVRSQSGAVIIPVTLSDGISLTNELIECFSEQIERIERNLNITIAELGHETKDAKTTSEQLKETREANDIEARKRSEQQVQDLAKQAAATATPAQKGPGRPKRATIPKPEVMQAVGAAAAQVPMNGSSPQAGGKASNLPQG